MERELDVVVVGCGAAGTVSALLLATQGHRVRLLERASDPGAVGAGILLQHLGQEVLDRLGLGEALRAGSRPVRRVDAITVRGRQVMDFQYADVPGSVPALGVHRGALFSVLYDAVLASEVEVETGVEVLDVRPVGERLEVTVSSPTGPVRWGSADLVVGADGTRSAVRRSLGVTLRDHPYSYGALWAVVPDPEEIAEDALYQCFRDTRHYLGVLPTGRGESSIFWSIRTSQMEATIERGIAAWRKEAAPFAGRYAPLLERVETLLPATYRDVVVRHPHRVTSDGRAAAVLLGDASHAMSPQLGAGASLALADGWTLAACLAEARDLRTGLTAYEQQRRAHVRWYTWWTRLMTPLFQSELVPLSWPRNVLAGPVAQVPVVRRQFVSTLMGHRTSPWSTWQLPGDRAVRSGEELGRQ